MTWEDEERKIRLEHQLTTERLVQEQRFEGRQKCWDRAIQAGIQIVATGVTVGLVGWLVNGYVTKYASDLRRDEFDHQLELELKQHRLAFTLEKELQATSLIDSSLWALWDRWTTAVMKISSERQTSASVAQRFQELINRAYAINQMLIFNRGYLNPDYFSQASCLCDMFRGIRGELDSNWLKYKPFMDIYVTRTSDLAYSIVVGAPKRPLPILLYPPLIDYSDSLKTPGDSLTKGTSATLRNNYYNWIKYRQQNMIQ